MTKSFLAAELARILPHAEYAEMPYIGKGAFADCSAKVEWSSSDEE